MRPALQLACLTLLLAAPRATAADDDLARLLATILGPSPIEENLRQLTDEIGGRVSGSEANRHAVTWAVEAFRQAGVERVSTEAFELPVGWREGATRVEMTAPRPFTVRAVSTAWSPPTPAGGIERPLLDLGLGTEADFARQSDRLAGALLLVSRRGCCETPATCQPSACTRSPRRSTRRAAVPRAGVPGRGHGAAAGRARDLRSRLTELRPGQADDSQPTHGLGGHAWPARGVEGVPRHAALVRRRGRPTHPVAHARPEGGSSALAGDIERQ